MNIYDTLALPTLLYGCETLALGEQVKARIIPGEIKFMELIKYTWQDYKTNEDILSEPSCKDKSKLQK
jgi:hypothetical protein